MSSSIQRTVAIPRIGNLGRCPVERSLVQLHPLDLQNGPIQLDRDSMIIGRSSDSAIRICDESVSRRHALLQRCGSTTEIVDLDSTNGVAVNGVPVDHATLHSGDRIQLGTRVFRFLADHDLERQYEETVYAMMTRDGLTGIYNRRYLTETLQREVARCKRHRRPIALIMADVDHFRRINNDYGPVAGDQVLRELSRRMDAVLRDDDVLARFDGQQFAILLVESNLNQAADVADRCRMAVESSVFDSSVAAIRVTLSLGVSAPEVESIDSPHQLVQDAESRMRRAKSGGHNCVVT